MIDEGCVPYPRRRLYQFLTYPMIVLYVLLGIFLWRTGVLYFVIYTALFVFVAVFMSYVCVHWGCPYVGKFAPCVGGFCLPSSQMARLLKNVKKTESRYNLFITLAYISFFGIILFPMYFLFVQGIGYLIGYLVIVLAYGTAFMLLICPVCATRNVCPGGQTSDQLFNLFGWKNPTAE
jgi:hypothetical protein